MHLKVPIGIADESVMIKSMHPAGDKWSNILCPQIVKEDAEHVKLTL